MMETLASLTLYFLQGLSGKDALKLLNHYGSAEKVLADAGKEFPQLRDRCFSSGALSVARQKAEKELELCEKRGIKVLPYLSEDYPQLLREENIADAPPVLFYSGKCALQRRRMLSIVGTRQMTDYGKDFIERFMADLARLRPDLLIVSGLAYGVDICAHRAALKNGLETLAVLAHGLDRVYPSLHRHTANEMVEHGGLLTEYPMGSTPERIHFVARNRIVAGMSAGTLVVESAAHGGGLITADLAFGYAREVMAVPGRVGDAYSEGCLRLVQQQKASLVTSAEDVLNVLGWKPEEPAKVSQPTLFPVYTAAQEKLLELLSSAETMSLDELVRATDMSIAQISDDLFTLEDMGVVRRVPGNRYRSVSL